MPSTNAIIRRKLPGSSAITLPLGASGRNRLTRLSSEIRAIGDVLYCNSGDWVESLTAIVEHFDGRFELIDFVSFAREFPLPAEESPVELAEA